MHVLILPTINHSTLFIESLFFSDLGRVGYFGRPKKQAMSFHTSHLNSLCENGVLVGEVWYISLNHLKASVATEDFVEGLGHAVLVELVLVLEVALLFAGVHDYDAWDFSFLEIEKAREGGFGGDVQSHEVKGDTTLNLARVQILNVVHVTDHCLIRLAC